MYNIVFFLALWCVNLTFSCFLCGNLRSNSPVGFLTGTTENIFSVWKVIAVWNCLSWLQNSMLMWLTLACVAFWNSTKLSALWLSQHQLFLFTLTFSCRKEIKTWSECFLTSSTFTGTTEIYYILSKTVIKGIFIPTFLNKFKTVVKTTLGVAFLNHGNRPLGTEHLSHIDPKHFTPDPPCLIPLLLSLSLKGASWPVINWGRNVVHTFKSSSIDFFTNSSHFIYSNLDFTPSVDNRTSSVKFLLTQLHVMPVYHMFLYLVVVLASTTRIVAAISTHVISHQFTHFG